MQMNDDLIDRTAAIEAISKYASIWMSYTDGMSKDEIAQEALNSAKQTMIRICRELPSVQPEIIRCKDCKFYDGRPCGIVGWYNTVDDFCSMAERRENG